MRTALTFPNNPGGPPSVPGPLVCPNVRARTRQLPRLVRPNTSGTVPFPKISIAGPLVAVNTRPRLKHLPITRRPESGQPPFPRTGPLVKPNVRRRVFPVLRVRPRQAQIVPLNSTTGPLVTPNVRARLKWLPIVRRPQFMPVPPETLSTTGPLVAPNTHPRLRALLRTTPRQAQPPVPTPPVPPLSNVRVRVNALLLVRRSRTGQAPVVPVPVIVSIPSNVRARVKALPLLRRSRTGQIPPAVPAVPAPNIRRRVFALLRPTPRPLSQPLPSGLAGTGPLVPQNGRPRTYLPRLARRAPEGATHMSRPGFVRPNVRLRGRPLPRLRRHLGADGFFPAPAAAPAFIPPNSRPRVTLDQRVLRRPNTSGAIVFPTINQLLASPAMTYPGGTYFAGGTKITAPPVVVAPAIVPSAPAQRRRLLVPARAHRGSVDAPVLPSNLAFTKLAPSGGPPTAVAVFGMTLDLAADATGKTVLLVGGDSGGGVAVGQQWHYTEPGGTPTWTSVSSTHTPWSLNGFGPGIADFQMVYEPGHAALVGYGGGDFGAAASNLTLTWNGTDWSALTLTNNPANNPSGGSGGAGRSEYTMSIDPLTGRLTMCNGFPKGTFPAMFADSYTLGTGTTGWVADGTAPSARAGAGMAYDPGRNIVVLFGGHNGSNSSPFATVLGDTWIKTTAGWTNPTPATSPGARYYPFCYYDYGLRMVVMGGGNTASVDDWAWTDWWGWNGSNWIKINADLVTELQVGGAIESMPALGHAIGFGGWPALLTSTPTNQTWKVAAQSPAVGINVVQYGMAQDNAGSLVFGFMPTQ